MEEQREQPRRKNIRLKGFDYSSTNVYFLTLCTKERGCVLSDIEYAVGDAGRNGYVCNGPHHAGNGGVRINLTEYGRVAEKYIKQLDEFYDHISVKHYVIMPDHVHMILLITESGPSGTPVPTASAKTPDTRVQNSTLSKFISTYKRFCNKECGESMWQPRSYDRVIRNRADYDKHVRYVREKPYAYLCERVAVGVRDDSRKS